METKCEIHHANCLQLGRKGLLIIGPSGSGKSTLTLSLLDRAKWSKRKAKLISDDYTILRVENGKLHGYTPDSLEGGIEIRGAGLYTIEFEKNTAINCVISLGPEYERFSTNKTFQFENLHIPLLKLPSLREADCTAICQAIEAFLFRKIWRKNV
ncbi:serine kinase of HPr protein (carbohydrate metabolism regulator) [Bartonella fuyuanensis]|uniref:Serine kinase of HPr protein (Carbohydrate metabolism regulator) n=1 Tax=Bartonella fuyuanensis TaxID=1460968 RepID=A0A840DZC5_9HYPH|nr:HPr kinase/phosphatase C-terminal domain-containing protein [Bartonella fuyuanensis]MBB4075937.1 serine kinase of HPr protein (carbohydrate metabolism regulator) [Bartonella fuyuanensis]